MSELVLFSIFLIQFNYQKTCLRNQILKKLSFPPKKRLSLRPQTLSLNPQKLSLSPQKLSLSPQKLSLSPQKLSLSPQKLSFNPQKLLSSGIKS